jgi:ATP-dependent Lon protease
MTNQNSKIVAKKTLSFKKTMEKVNYFYNVISDTIIWIEKYKNYDIINSSDLNVSIQNLENIYKELILINNTLYESKKSSDQIVSKLQKINDEISMIFKSFGTKNIENILNICYGNRYLKNIINDDNFSKFELILKYAHPISYKVMQWKNKPKKINNNEKILKNKIIEDFMIIEIGQNLDCYDLCRTTNNFYTKVFGVKIVFQNPEKKNTIIINAIIDEILLTCLKNDYIQERKQKCLNNSPKDPEFKNKHFLTFINHLSIKEWMIYNDNELYNRFVGYNNQAHLIKQKTISQIVKEFINNDLFNQRKTLTILLLQSDDNEFQYLAYLLYDLLSNENNGNIDTFEQTLLFDSLSWEIKKSFRYAMKNTIKYTKNLASFDNSKIPIEQQICLLKASDEIKEKAMIKLKEVKAKSEDSGSKARQYLEGLLKIPFGIYKKENILELADTNSNLIIQINKKNKDNNISFDWDEKNIYTNQEISNIITSINSKILIKINNRNIERLIKILTEGKKYKLISNICQINSIIKKNNIKCKKLCHSGKKNNYMKNTIIETINKFKNDENFIHELLKNKNKKNIIDNTFLKKNIIELQNNKNIISNNLNTINQTLENSVYGHLDAKRQLERIIGQWITGKQSGYCFGFEGAPGIGKTSLAKNGLAHCLKDKNGNSRPFAFIALGGSSNGSTLAGHNYTYVGSTWGRIVDILMEKKCMNPIIFIDELDKVSRTEHGKEIIGILTHLIDPTQNMAFQDKYFNGVDLDMSKVLFIFSYNDVNAIDKILLDRIHRIKFNHLTLKDKIEIVNKFILPEIYENIGIENIINIDNKVIEFIVENYTREAGVRKLKEIMFEIISEINLNLLKETEKYKLPLVITKNDIEKKYLKNRTKITYTLIHTEPKIGVINGLWANSLGMGGVIPIQAFYFPSNNLFELKLTGMQGDVMKESMNVAKTLAWNLTSNKNKKTLYNKKNNEKGLHIHCPEGAVPKDGPSAGTAITTAIYSLINKKKIKNDIAITGEINLQGFVTEIGGLELKILGGIRAGVKTFIYPKSNKKDFDKFLEKYPNIDISNIEFHHVSKIEEVLKLVFI